MHPGTIDFTAIPKQLDSKFEAHDTDSALRPTIIKTDSTWSRLRQENLLTKAQKSSLGPEEIKSEKSKAFDLLDALSRSGSLPIACAELHVVVAVTHCFTCRRSPISKAYPIISSFVCGRGIS